MVCVHASDLPLDAALRALGAAPRRRALRYLIDGPGVVAVSELVDRLHSESAADSDATRVDAGRSRLDRHVGLVHVHLPLLEEIGMIEFDRRSRTVVVTETAATLDPLLTAVGAFECGNQSGR